MRTKNEELFRKIEKCIADWTDEYGYAPTVYEIADRIGSTKSTVQRYIAQMCEEGRFDYTGHRSLVDTRSKMQSVHVPILGSIACGIPKYAEENIDEYIRLPVSLFGKGEFFFLRAYGDSMTDAGIDDGDLVLIRHQSTAESGQIVVALIEDEATLKRYYPEPENQRIRLHPENSRMADIYVDRCDIQGVAEKVIKELGV